MTSSPIERQQPRIVSAGSTSAGTAPRGADTGDAESRVDPELLAGLNPQQRGGVLSRGQSLLIVGGAGSGKTGVLPRRIAGLLQARDAWPSQILAITFTNKAAGEMRE